MRGLRLGDTRVVTYRGTAANGGGFTPNRGSNRVLANVVFDKPVQLLQVQADIKGSGDSSGNQVISSIVNYRVRIPNQNFVKPVPTETTSELSLDNDYIFILPENRIQAFPDLAVVEAEITAEFKNNNGEDTTYDDVLISIFYAELLNL